MTRIHAVICQKGGVGKTTIVVHTAAVVADTMGGTPDNTPVLGASTDPQASMLEWADRGKETLPFDFLQCSDDPQQLRHLRNASAYREVFVDTPGSLEDEDIVREVLAIADDVIVPIEPEPMCFRPVARTIDKVVVPSGKPYKVVINNWDPRDGTEFVDQTKEFLERRGYPRFNTVIRHYRLHVRAPALGLTVISYANNRVAMAARQDFLKFGIEVISWGAETGPRHAAADSAGGNAVSTEDTDAAGNGVSSQVGDGS